MECHQCVYAGGLLRRDVESDKAVLQIIMILQIGLVMKTLRETAPRVLNLNSPRLATLWHASLR